MENCLLHFTFDDLILREILTKLQHFMDHHIVVKYFCIFLRISEDKVSSKYCSVQR